MVYEEKYLQLLKEKYQTKEAVLSEIINLEAILHLPKGTEHFVSDIHGEFLPFQHLLRTGSGAIKAKIAELFDGELDKEAQNQLATLVYYPKEKLQDVKNAFDEEADDAQLTQFYQQALKELLLLTSYCGKKYSRSKVRKALPSKYAYILEELLTEIKKDPLEQKNGYCQAIVSKIIQLGQAEDLICVLADTICQLVVDHVHVVGDLYDRGSDPDKIIDRMMKLPSVDIQWGNHDLNWIGAVGGSYLGMINVIRICARYDNLAILEESYGINLRPLIQYVRKNYPPVARFAPKINPDHDEFAPDEEDLLNGLQQAAAVIQFKLEDALISRRPEFQLEARQVLQQVNYREQTMTISGQTYPLVDFPSAHFTAEQPSTLTAEEKTILHHLMRSFQHSERLKRHTDFLLAKGGMYLCYNNNLLFHGCIPLHSNGDFKSIRFNDTSYAGKKLLDYYEKMVRQAYDSPRVHDDFATDLLWYLWCGESSSLFGKEAMTTFERYFIADPATHVEKKNAYYALRNDPKVAEEILQSFGLTAEGHIINGHTPVKEKRGENPIKADGKVIVIDGGFAKGYQAQTGLAGYTLVYNSFGMQLVAHLGFSSVKEVVKTGQDILGTRRLVDTVPRRMLIKETNIGKKLASQKNDLEKLYRAFN